MIYWLTKEDFDHPPLKLINGLSDFFIELQAISYESIFFEKRIPFGHYIFSDFDRMSSYEMECAISLTDAIRQHSPSSMILNDPRRVLERVPLLEKLYRVKLNQFSVTRIDTSERPTHYPIFIRSEDECRGPDTGLLYSLTEVEGAIKKLQQQGHTLKRRIAVEFCAEKDKDGWYRKYGVFKIGDSIIPQHILRDKDWNVKSNKAAEFDDTFVEEELKFVLKNPHQEQLRQIFKLAKVDFGRIDYTLVNGKIQTFEINTNPTFPQLRGRDDARSERRSHIRVKVVEALVRINLKNLDPIGEFIRFSLPQPCLEYPRIPRNASFLTRFRWALKQ